MKPRRVVVTLEVETDAALADIRAAMRIVKLVDVPFRLFDVSQVQVNMIRAQKLPVMYVERTKKQARGGKR